MVELMDELIDRILKKVHEDRDSQPTFGVALEHSSGDGLDPNNHVVRKHPETWA